MRLSERGGLYGAQNGRAKRSGGGERDGQMRGPAWRDAGDGLTGRLWRYGLREPRAGLRGKGLLGRVGACCG